MKALLSFGIAMIVSLTSYSQTERIIDWLPVATGQAYTVGDNGKLLESDTKALEIVEIRVEVKTITPGLPFLVDNDWLKSFAVKVRNISNKKISSIRLHFALPETKSLDSQMGFSLEYGKELSTGIDYGLQAAIEPGEEVVLIRNDRHYSRDKEGIAKRTGKADFSALTIGLSTVRFEDGTVWMAAKLPVASTVTALN
ncbi:MAG: hypothetical protein WBO10_18025 [Pyrinomonadaceae bacterium]